MLVPDPVPDPTLVIDPALPRDFRKLTSVDLQPVFDVEVSRETRHLTSDRARIDVSLDDGAIVAGEEREPICEIELELVAGELDDLFAEVQRISDAVDGRLHARTLTDLGYALKTADRKHWSRATKLDFTPGMTAHDAFRLIVFNAFSHLTANDDCARFKRHIEGVHQCRVALRRLQSAFKIYRPCCAASASSRWWNRCAGWARSWGRRAISTCCKSSCSTPPSRHWAKASNWRRCWSI
jgi:inorganic triphosphatase YgiF